MTIVIKKIYEKQKLIARILYADNSTDYKSIQ